MMQYDLTKLEDRKPASWAAIARRYLVGEWWGAGFALITVLIGSFTAILGPYLIGKALDEITINRDYQATLSFLPILIGVYIVSFFSDYSQIIVMGSIGQRILYKLRQQIFAKLQDLPLAFFNANKAGDLISRINKDTDKINTVISEGLIRLIGSVFSLIGVAIAMLVINFQLGVTVLGLTVVLIILTQLVSPLLRRLNRRNLDASGDLSAQIQESLNGFKAIVAYNRQDFATEKFNLANSSSRAAGLWSSITNQLINPSYELVSNLASMLVVLVGLNLVFNATITFGVLFTFITYTRYFYEPLRTFASIWTSVQTGMAAWSRVSDVLDLQSNMPRLPISEIFTDKKELILELRNVGFTYPDGYNVYEGVNLQLEIGKTYALVGPTGGGKSTTASLMARLYDSTTGEVLLHNRDIRTFNPAELADSIGFILQEPYLFTGTVAENIMYGLKEAYTEDALLSKLQSLGLDQLLARFPEGLKTEVSNGAENISLGQKQLVAFMRILLRQPKLLILDEATANIDTITEELLQRIIAALPKDTTKVVIAHRLNTIDNADEIIFVGGGKLQNAEDVAKVTELLKKD